MIEYIVRQYTKNYKYEYKFCEGDLELIYHIFFSEYLHLGPSVKKIELVKINEKGIEKILRVKLKNENENSNTEQERKKRI
jgi:hypothetical protein